MKALFLSLLVMIALDEAFDRGAGVQGCSTLLIDLVRGTERDVSGSVYRQ